MRKEDLKKIEKRINQIKEEIMCIFEVAPGTLTKQYNVCGKKTCICKDKHSPKKHGPYYQLGFFANRKHSTAFVKKEFASEIKIRLSNGQKLRQH